MPKVWFLGEALIDFVPVSANGQTSYAPRCGGSPYNAAIAAARQGAQAGFLGAISTDLFGDQLATHLLNEGIDISHAPRSNDPTTLAFVDLDGAEPRYAFFNRMSATQLMNPDPDTINPCAGDILHVGSIALIDNPAANNIHDFVHSLASRMIISVDPNARPSMTDNPDDWRHRIESLLAVADIVNLSQEDLDFLDPDATSQSFAKRLLSDRTQLVVVTDSENGATGWTRATSLKVPAIPTELVDTVGAGDTVTGTLLADVACRRSIETAFSIAELQTLLQRAMKAAAIKCSRSGCSPPRTDEIDQG